MFLTRKINTNILIRKAFSFIKLRIARHTEVEKTFEQKKTNPQIPNISGFSIMIKRSDFEKEKFTDEEKEKLKRFDIFRYNPDESEEKQIISYYVDLDNCGPMILDALIKIKDEKDSTLSFRR